MAIPRWISAAAAEADKNKNLINFSDDTYNRLLEMYKAGQLDEASSQLVEEIETLRGVINTAVAKASQGLLGISKEAAPKEGPLEVGDERLREVPLAPTPKPGVAPTRRLPGKIKEPETTKWKEIRFNKRTGTWQVVVTIRHTRNFMSENEAVEFTKKAELEGRSEITSDMKFTNPGNFKGEGYYVVAGGSIVQGPFLDMMEANKIATTLEGRNPGKTFDVSYLTIKSVAGV